jgi:hypothetical protein
MLREGRRHDLPQLPGDAVQIGFAGQDTERHRVGRPGAEGEAAGGGVGDERTPANMSPSGPAVPSR